MSPSVNMGSLTKDEFNAAGKTVPRVHPAAMMVGDSVGLVLRTSSIMSPTFKGKAVKAKIVSIGLAKGRTHVTFSIPMDGADDQEREFIVARSGELRTVAVRGKSVVPATRDQREHSPAVAMVPSQACGYVVSASSLMVPAALATA